MRTIVVSPINRPILPLLLGLALLVHSSASSSSAWAEPDGSGCSRFLIHVRVVKAERSSDQDLPVPNLVSQKAVSQQVEGVSVELNSVALGSAGNAQRNAPNNSLSNAQSSLPGEILIDKRLRDIAPKLNKLPYKTFTLVAMDDRVVPLRRRDTFNLPNGQTLTLRPMYLEDGKVGLWIKWLDQSEVSILDSRMHFELGESVLAGTDSTPASGLILAVDVKPAK